MNKLQQILFKNCTIVLCFCAIGVYGQKQSKTYKETFNVGDEAVLDINTSHADIEFETWDKNQVVVEAIIELEGATAEEAENYFKKGGVKILGNSKNIEISTGAENSWLLGHTLGDVDVSDFVIEIPEFPELEPLFLDLEIPDMSEFTEFIEMPPMPPIPFTHFDYEAYKKDGEKYMKEWKKEFDESFDEDYKQQMKEWSQRMKERAQERKQHMEERAQERKQLMEERKQQREELLQQREELREKVREEREKMNEEHDRMRKEERDVRRNIIISRGDRDDESSIFYRSFDGEGKNYKVKKIIKIKMPKSVKLKMNVRHGEVKLAQNTKNIDATLSYSRLLASTIEGDKTNISASYSPITVQRWDYGKLKTDFSEDVSLNEVGNLILYSNSSDVTIDRLLNSASIQNNLGALQINSVAKNFTAMDISVQYGELVCELPSTPYTIYVNGTSSKLTSPAYLVLDKTTEKRNNTVHKGFHINKNANRSITINAQYSEVVLEK